MESGKKHIALEDLRRSIDALNDQILDLLIQRGRLVCKIGELARDGRAPGNHDEAREKAMLESLCKANPGPYSDEDIKAIFRVIFERSLEIKKRLAHS